jgi:hypothetical protein
MSSTGEQQPTVVIVAIIVLVASVPVLWQIGGLRAMQAAERQTELADQVVTDRQLPNDHDGDGIPDASDECPTRPETDNGFQDPDGCPDVVETTGAS